MHAQIAARDPEFPWVSNDHPALPPTAGRYNLALNTPYLHLQAAVDAIEASPDWEAVEHYLVDTCKMEPEEAHAATEGYIQYAVAEMAKANGMGQLSPTIAIDQAWHAHVLHTRRYEAFCRQHFGKFLHHNPEAGYAIVQPQLEVTRRLVNAVFLKPSSTWADDPVMCNNCGGYD